MSKGHFWGGFGQARRRSEGEIRLIGLIRLIGPIRLTERHGDYGTVWYGGSTSAITHCDNGTAQRRLARIA